LLFVVESCAVEKGPNHNKHFSTKLSILPDRSNKEN